MIRGADLCLLDRSRSTRHDLFRKTALRAFTKQDVGLALYGTLGVAFTISPSTGPIGIGRPCWPARHAAVGRRDVHTDPADRPAVVVIGPVVRGLISLVRSIGRRIRAVARRIRFRLETRWRVEAAELIDALPIFEDVPVDVLNELAGRVRLRTLATNQPCSARGTGRRPSTSSATGSSRSWRRSGERG